MKRTFVVVGAGIVGASIAYHLSRRGAAVTVLDQASAPAAGVTGNSFGWFSGVGGGWPGGAADLRGSILEDYRRLEAEVPGLSVRWSGSVVWTDTSVRLRNGMQLVDGQRWITRDEIASLEPNLKRLPERALYTATDAGIDPVTAAAALVTAAGSHGAQVVLDSGAASLRQVNGQVVGVVARETFYPADTVIIAAAAGAPGLCAHLGIELPMTTSPAFWLAVAAPVGLVKTILVTPEFEVRESRDGLLRMTALHEEGASAAALQQLAERTVDRLRSSFGEADNVHLVDYGVCQRPMPVDGPIIGYLTSDTSVYAALMHSGITLAPTVGRLVAEELVGGTVMAALARCRPRAV